MVHAAHADEERALIEWSKRNRQARAKIRKRRDVQFETFKFAQKRLSDNRDALQQLDRRVRETNRLGLAKRRQIDDEAAAMAASQAQEMLIIDAAARASEEERRLLQDFAERREGTTADLVATHALCEDLERQRRQEMAEHSRRVARDKRQLEQTAEGALLAARRAELAKTKARLSRTRGSRSSRWSAWTARWFYIERRWCGCGARFSVLELVGGRGTTENAAERTRGGARAPPRGA